MSKNNSNDGIVSFPMVAKSGTENISSTMRHKWLPILLILAGPQVLSACRSASATEKGRLRTGGITSAG